MVYAKVREGREGHVDISNLHQYFLHVITNSMQAPCAPEPFINYILEGFVSYQHVDSL